MAGTALGALVCLFWLLGTGVLHRALWGRAPPSPQVPRGWLGHGLWVGVCAAVEGTWDPEPTDLNSKYHLATYQLVTLGRSLTFTLPPFSQL